VVSYKSMVRQASSARGVLASAPGHLKFEWIRGASGRYYTKSHNVQGLPDSFRECFLPDSEDSVFVLFDYKATELYLNAIEAGQEDLARAIESGKDPHRWIYAKMMGISEEEVTDEQRKIGKTINYAIQYGASPFTVAGDLGTSEEHARELMSLYWEALPKIKVMRSRLVAEAHRTGKTKTVFGGMERSLENIHGDGEEMKSDERRALNTAFQGSAADLTKLGMVNLHKAGYKVRFQVHDSILVEIPRATYKQAIEECKSILEIVWRGYTFRVDTKVSNHFPTRDSGKELN